jgi:hypothetical protein
MMDIDDSVDVLVTAFDFDPLNINMDFVCFRQAVMDAQVDRVQASLVEGKVDPTVLDNWAIRRVCDSGDAKLAAVLLNDVRVDPTSLGNCCLLHAAYKGHVEIMKLLLDDGRPDPCIDDHQAIRSAALCGHARVVKLLLEDGRSNPAAQENAALYCGAKDGLNDIVSMLLEDNRVAQGSGVVHALSEATERGHLKTASLFAEYYEHASMPPTFAVGGLSLQTDDTLPNREHCLTAGQKFALGSLTSRKTPLTVGQKQVLGQLREHVPFEADIHITPGMLPADFNAANRFGI